MPSGSDRRQPGEPKVPLPDAARRRLARRGIGAAERGAARSGAEPPHRLWCRERLSAALGRRLQVPPGAAREGAGARWWPPLIPSRRPAVQRVAERSGAVQGAGAVSLPPRGAPAEFRRGGRGRRGQLPPLLPALSPHWPGPRGQVAGGRARAPLSGAACGAEWGGDGMGAECGRRAPGTGPGGEPAGAGSAARPSAVMGGSEGSGHLPRKGSAVGRAPRGSRVIEDLVRHIPARSPGGLPWPRRPAPCAEDELLSPPRPAAVPPPAG